MIFYLTIEYKKFVFDNTVYYLLDLGLGVLAKRVLTIYSKLKNLIYFKLLT